MSSVQITFNQHGIVENNNNLSIKSLIYQIGQHTYIGSNCIQLMAELVRMQLKNIENKIQQYLWFYWYPVIVFYTLKFTVLFSQKWHIDKKTFITQKALHEINLSKEKRKHRREKKCLMRKNHSQNFIRHHFTK